MSAAEHTGKLVLDVPRTGTQPRGGAAGAGPGLPQRRRLHHHRRPGRPRAVPGREDGRGGLRPDRAHRALAAEPARRRRPSSDPRATGADIVVECGNIAEAGHRGAAGGRGHRHRASAARCAARRGGGRGRHPGQHHRRAHRPGLGAQGLRRLAPAPARRPDSRWTGSAPSPRRPPCWARRARAPTPRPTAGWTPSPTGGAPRACRPPRSRGARGPRSAAAAAWPRAAGPR